MSLLRVDSVDVSYGAVQVLRGVSLEVGEGEMVALLGANGAGKTTMLRTISGMVSPTAGVVTMSGDRIDGVRAHRLVSRGIAHLPEGRELFPSLSVEDNLRYGHWTRRRDRADYTRRLGMVMDHFPRLAERRSQAAGTLSGGEQQMLGVARALMSSPRLLLVDELSLGLAPMVVQSLFAILAEINRAGAAVLLVEQFVHMALAHTDRAYVMSKGEVVLSGASSKLATDPALVATYLGDAESLSRVPSASRGSPRHASGRAAPPNPRRASSERMSAQRGGSRGPE